MARLRRKAHQPDIRRLQSTGGIFMTDFALGRTILDRAEQQLNRRGAAALDGLCGELSEYRKTLGAEWPEFAKDHFGRHSIQRALHESPGWRRAYEKPRGYAG